MLQIHGRAQSVCLGAYKAAGEDSLEQLHIVAARGVAGSGCTAVAGGHEFKRLRLGGAHAAGGEAQALGALLHIDHGAEQVALFAPELQNAAAVGFAHSVVGGAHIEENAAILEQRGGGVVCEVIFNAF